MLQGTPKIGTIANLTFCPTNLNKIHLHQKNKVLRLGRNLWFWRILSYICVHLWHSDQILLNNLHLIMRFPAWIFQFWKCPQTLETKTSSSAEQAVVMLLKNAKITDCIKPIFISRQNKTQLLIFCCCLYVMQKFIPLGRV